MFGPTFLPKKVAKNVRETFRPKVFKGKRCIKTSVLFIYSLKKGINRPDFTPNPAIIYPKSGRNLHPKPARIYPKIYLKSGRNLPKIRQEFTSNPARIYSKSGRNSPKIRPEIYPKSCRNLLKILPEIT